MMYPNLEAELKRAGYTKGTIAEALGVHVSAVYRMMSGERKINITKAMEIRDKLFPNMAVDYLFDQTPKAGG